jgi:hypothetical protein
LENNIELCIIDTSNQKYFKENTSKIYLDIILKIINDKLLDVVSSKLDGELNDKNTPNLYDLSGDTFFAPATTDGSIANVYTVKVADAIKEFESILSELKMVTDYYDTGKSVIDNGNGCDFNINNTPTFVTCENNRFFIAMSPLFTKPDLYTTFVNGLTSGPEVKSNPTLVNRIEASCLNYKENVILDYTALNKGFAQTKDNGQYATRYKTVTSFKLPDNTVKKCNYTTTITQDEVAKRKKITDLYANQNLNNDKKSFNGKVTFN